MNDPHVLCQVVAAGGIGGVVTVGTHLILDFEQFEQLMMNRFHVVVQVLLCAHFLARFVVTVWTVVNFPFVESLHVLLKFLGCHCLVHALTTLK